MFFRALEWCEGYYNGDIKTRKTVQAGEVNMDQLGLQRSDQLRELYESLSLGETKPQAKRPTAALSPEDLTDAEWFFLVCMSFVFNTDQGYLSFLLNQFDVWFIVSIMIIFVLQLERSKHKTPFFSDSYHITFTTSSFNNMMWKP